MGTKRPASDAAAAAAAAQASATRRALGEPTRFAIVQYLHTADRAARVDELAQAMSVHHNAIRAHLNVLMEVGIVERERAARLARGRPAWVHRLTPGASTVWRGSAPQEELALMLLDVLTTKRSPREVGRERGAELAAAVADELVADQPGDAGPGDAGPGDAVSGDAGPGGRARRVLEVITRDLGFAPRTDPAAPHVILLRHCPFAAAASQAREIICGLHLGVAEGVCRATGDALSVAALHVADPHVGPCRLELA